MFLRLKDRLTISCPWHDEQTPSCQVCFEWPGAYCFGCGKSTSLRELRHAVLEKCRDCAKRHKSYTLLLLHPMMIADSDAEMDATIAEVDATMKDGGTTPELIETRRGLEAARLKRDASRAALSRELESQSGGGSRITESAP